MPSRDLLGDFDPEDAIINLDNGTTVVDRGKYLIGLLKQEWNTGNTDGRKPRVEPAELTKGVSFREDDWIVVYSVSAPVTPVTITYQFTNEEETLTFDFFTKRDRTHLKKMMEEARRVILSARKDTFGNSTDGRDWLEWGIRFSPYDNTTKNHYRRAVDVRLHNRFREIKT